MMEVTTGESLLAGVIATDIKHSFTCVCSGQGNLLRNLSAVIHTVSSEMMVRLVQFFHTTDNVNGYIFNSLVFS